MVESRAEVPRDAWEPLLAATDHEVQQVKADSHEGYQWGADKELRRHDFTTPIGVRSLWEVWHGEGGMSNGEGDYSEESRVYSDEDAAREQYVTHKLK
ncbi:hypothetical protein AB0942_33975 [Streptomyces nodosus]|uniref:hypothetical protein n=1 Tax=Streptomyces nodosus TaxID=40318 RepID=UPI0034569035